MATMRKPTLSSSSSITNEWAYDVFLSFRGEDTREGFIGHLYNDLCKKGINTFMDDQELQKGDEITPSLMMAIQQSRIVIVIFSKNYASSSFCLEELTEIMECIKHKGRLVWPVFYQVDPSDVRHQRGSYAEALAKHERKNIDKEKIKRWRLALQDAANLSGSHFEHGYEYELIGKITQEVSKKINRKPLHVAKYPVGLESRVQKVNSLLEVESDDEVHMVGIHGMGGLGKTTLACAVYNSIADRFDGLCFLGDVRKNSMKYGLVQLQEMLLSELAGLQNVKLGNVNKGIPIIKSKLCQKKILLILDDVNKSEQLEALAGGQEWFGVGSKIIITTRDKHVLQVHGVEKIYEVQVLNHEEAVELFSWNAFKTKEANPSYMDLSKTALLRYNGLPLSLEIIGSDLCGKTVLEWKSALETYEKIPHENILEILKVSYDGLKEIEKEIFLDIACFFKGDDQSDVIDILHSGRGFVPDYAIGVLIDKSLIKLDGNRVMMHDMIEDMGREIVRLESPLKPGERSRLWFPKDILHVFKENKGSDKTEIIILRQPKHKTIQWDGNALKQMENLKILVIKNASLSRGPNHLPKSLSVLKWSGYPESSLPAHFNPKKLVILDLYESFISFENQLIMKFKSLTKMNLRGCEFLKQVPDMSGAQNLKWLNLDHCKNLVEVHDSVGFLGKLEYLDLRECRSLRFLPRGINLPSLKFLSLWGCGSLKSFPEILYKMEKLTKLDLDFCGIRELPFSIGRLVCLEVLTMSHCNELLELPSSIFMLPRLGTLNAFGCRGFARINKGERICQEQETTSSYVATDVNFRRCHLSDEVVATLFPFMHHVTGLRLDGSSIRVLPSSINACRSMKELTLDNCKELREIRGLPPNIEYLGAKNCTSLTSISMMLLGQKFKSLKKMKLSFCESLKQVPDMSGAQNLKWLNLDHCKNLVEVHDSVGFLGKLEYLDLLECRSLRVLPRGINLPSLKFLSLWGCGSLKSFPEILNKMEKLTKLDLDFCGIRELPFSIGRLVCLEVLTMSHCDELLVLPSSIFMLPRLGTFNAFGCRRFARINKGEGICQEQETTSSVVTTDVNFCRCHLSDEVVATLFPFMHHVTGLRLDGSSIRVLPSSINACRSMKELTLDNCKELREIRGLPPNIEYLGAENCTSLTSISMMLLGQNFKSLIEMNLSFCKSLKQVPDMSGAQNLKRLHLVGCENLVEVHDSVGFLGKLEYLYLDECRSLRVFPRGINLPSLKSLSLRGCRSLMSFPEILDKMEKLTKLNLGDSGISELPFSIGRLVCLEVLTMSHCDELLVLPSSIFMLPRLGTLNAFGCRGFARINKGEGIRQEQETTSSDVTTDVNFRGCHLSDEFVATLFPFMHHVTGLKLDGSNIGVLSSSINACRFMKELTLDNCKGLQEIRGLPPNIEYLGAENCTSLTSISMMLLGQEFKSLTKMNLSFCKSLKQVPDMSGAQNLKRLNLVGCENLVEVHDSVGFHGKLEYLCLDECRSLRVLPRDINLPSLQSLSLEGCRSLKSFPEIVDKMEQLTELRLSRSGISELPFSIGRLVCLEVLTMYDCDKLVVLPSSIFMLPRLGTLKAFCCAGIARINKGEGICQELETMSSDVTTNVNFSCCHLSDEFVATLFPFMHHVNTLNLNVSSITVLPPCINACRSMKKLTLSYCEELQEIRGLPPNIEYLEANNCTSLTSQSKEMLLNQTLLNSNSKDKLVFFPGSTIPWWSNPLYRSEPSLSFLFRNKFPAIALCVAGVLGPMQHSYGKALVKFEFDLIINDRPWFSYILHVGWIEPDHTRIFLPNHIILLDLKFKNGLDKIGKLHFENEWNRAEISLVNKSETNVDMKWMRVHVLEQETNMEDFQIIPAVPIVEEENENIIHL